MNKTTLVFLEKDQYMFVSFPNSIIFRVGNDSMILSFVFGESCFFSIKVNEHLFYSLIEKNTQFISNLGLILQDEVTLDKLLSNFTLAVEINETKWPSNIVFFPSDSKAQIILTLQFDWYSVDQQFFNYLKLKSEVEAYKKDNYELRLLNDLSAISNSAQQLKITEKLENLSTKVENYNEKINLHSESIDEIKVMHNSEQNSIVDMLNSRIDKLVYSFEASFKDYKDQSEKHYIDLEYKYQDALAEFEAYKQKIQIQLSCLETIKLKQEEQANLLPTANQLDEINTKLGTLDKKVMIETENSSSKLNQINEKLKTMEIEIYLIHGELPMYDYIIKSAKKQARQMSASNLKLSKAQKGINFKINNCFKRLELIKSEEKNIKDLNETSRNFSKKLDLVIRLVESVSKSCTEHLRGFSPVKDSFQSNYSFQSKFEFDKGIVCCFDLNRTEYLVGCSDGSVHLIDKGNHQITKSLPLEHTNWVSIALAVGDILVTGSYDKTIKLWNLLDQAKPSIRTFKDHTGHVCSLAHLRDKLIASGSGDYSIKLWDLDSEKCIQTFKFHTNEVSGLLMYNRQTLLSVSIDKSIRLWDILPDAYKSAQSFSIITQKEMTCCIQLTKTTVAVGTNGAIDIWDIERSEFLYSLEGHAGWILRITRLSPDLVGSCSEDCTIKIWNLMSKSEIIKLEGHLGWVYGLIRLNKSQLLSASYDKTIRLWGAEK